MRKTLIFAIAIVLIYSCTPAAKVLYGIKKPQLETHSSIREFVANHAIDTSRILYIKDLRSFASASQMKILSFPDAIFFNKDGKMVRYKKSSAQCNAAVADFITDLKKLNSMQPELVGLTEMSNLTDEKIIPNDSVTVLITFVKYAGKLNRTKAFEWVRLLEKAKADGISVNYYLLSCDYQKNWNIPPALYEKLGIRN